jgi:cytoskeletal protein RodZ
MICPGAFIISLKIARHNATLAPNSNHGYSRHDASFMSTEELGNRLVEARVARGLTLRDVERDTRISSKYLQALEEGRLNVLPAPVYARAFMRTYAQYLGLNGSEFVQQLPGARPEPELPPLPDVGRGAAPLISASWAVAGVVIVLLLVVGLLFFWNRGGGGETLVSNPPVVEQPDGFGAEQPTPPADAPRQPLTVEPGIVPDLEAEHVLVAIAALAEAGMRYVVVEVENADVDEGIIFQQSPSPGTPIDADTVVTVVASR